MTPVGVERALPQVAAPMHFRSAAKSTLNVIPAFIAGIHCSGTMTCRTITFGSARSTCCSMDPGDMPRDDTVEAYTPTQRHGREGGHPRQASLSSVIPLKGDVATVLLNRHHHTSRDLRWMAACSLRSPCASLGRGHDGRREGDLTRMRQQPDRTAAKSTLDVILGLVPRTHFSTPAWPSKRRRPLTEQRIWQYVLLVDGSSRRARG